MIATASESSRRIKPDSEAEWRELLLLIPGYDPFATAPEGSYFDPEAAQLALDFFPEMLVHVDGALAGTPLYLEPWQGSIVANLFGWKRADGTRRFRESLIYIPRKNGKTTLCAGLALFLLIADGEPGAQIFSAAGDREQAAICFRAAKLMVEKNDLLSVWLQVFRTYKSMELHEGGGFYKAISAEAPTKHGLNAHGVIFDELHVQPDYDLMNVLQTSMGSRRQPLCVYLTTADVIRPVSPCNDKRDYAVAVRDREIVDPAFLPVVYEADPEDDWTSPDIWAKANPNLGISVTVEFLERECLRAQKNPALENDFKRLYLNIRTEQAVRFVPMDEWDKPCEISIPTEEMLRGMPCWMGVDLSARRDFTAVVLAWPHEGGYITRPWFWLPEARANERREKGLPTLEWAQKGYLEICPGKDIDFESVERRVVEICDTYKVREIAFDPWNAESIAQRLDVHHGFKMVRFKQSSGYMNEPTQLLVSLVIEHKLAHGGHPVLRWMASNVAGEKDRDNRVRPSRKSSGDNIDGIVALIMALGRAMLVETDTSSVYETRGMIGL